MSATFKFNKEKTYTFTESELARLLGNHIALYFTITRGTIIPQEAVEKSYSMTLNEMKTNKLIENLNRNYSDIIDDAKRAKERLQKLVDND